MSEQLAQVLPLRKRCNTCKAEKPVTEFYRLGKGYQAKCKTCKAEYDHAQQIARKANPPPPAPEGTCGICHQTKPANEFYKSRRASNGLQGSCKPCQKLQKQKRAEEFRKNPVRATERRCAQCKLVKPASEFHTSDTNTSTGLQSRCKDCARVVTRDWYNEHPGVREAYRISLQGLYASLKGQANSRGLSVTLSFEEFAQLREKACTYCGYGLPERGCGLDRLDNDRGYEPGNCVSCCEVCNKSRGDFWTPAEMQIIGKLFRQLRSARGAPPIA